MKIIALPIYSFYFVASMLSYTSAAAPVIAVPHKMASTRLPFAVEEIAGLRPVIPVKVNGVPFFMVIHSNAGLSVQIDHDLAKEANVVALRHSGNFGISAPGQLSKLGRDEGVIRSLSIGGASYVDVPTSIFETAENKTRDNHKTGMLGLQWITTNRVIMDFNAHTVMLNPSSRESASLRESLRRLGYQAVPMSIDPVSNRYQVAATIGGITRQMIVSTVANTTIDDAFAKTAGVAAGSIAGSYGGPKGNTGQIYSTARPVTINLAGWQSPPIVNAWIEDTYSYTGDARPSGEASGGQLGGDFALTNHAIIDFGGMTLYLPRK